MCACVCMNMMVSDVSRIVDEGLDVDIIVSPRSGRSGPEGFDEWRKRLVIKVKAPPLDGKANKEVETLFREITGCTAEVRSGHKDRQKTVRIFGDAASITERLEGST